MDELLLADSTTTRGFMTFGSSTETSFTCNSLVPSRNKKVASLLMKMVLEEKLWSVFSVQQQFSLFKSCRK